MRTFADSLGFFAKHMADPVIDPQERPQVSIMHLTSVPPVKGFRTSFEEALKEHERFKKIALGNKDVMHIRSAADIPVPAPQIGVLFGMQHAPEGINCLGQVQELAAAGVQFMSLAYDGPTTYGNGFLQNGPLTTQGRNLIAWMAECGIILDVSHASDRTAFDALEFIHNEKFEMKPLASHSASRSVLRHPRNIWGDAMNFLGVLKGYVGIPLITFFITREEWQNPFYHHLAYHIEKAGESCGLGQVGIGSDSIHRDMTMREAEEHYKKMTANLATNGRFGEFFPDRPPAIITQGSRMFRVLDAALSPYLGTGILEGVCGKNFQDYLLRALPQV